MTSIEAQLEKLEGFETKPISKKYLEVYKKELKSCRRQFFNILCDLAIRKGLAIKWCENEEDSQWAYSIATDMSIRTLFGNGFILAPEDDSTVITLNDTKSEIRSLYHEIEKLKTSVKTESNKIKGMQSWVSDFSIIGRARNKLARFVK